MYKIAFHALLKIAPLVLLLTACSLANLGNSSRKNRTTPNAVTEIETADNWTEHQDPAGFAVEIPRGWKVTSDAGRITVAGPNKERVTIFPLRVEGQLDGARARNVLLGIGNEFWPGRKWTMPRGGWEFGQDGVRAVETDGSGGIRATAAIWWANTQQGASCFFYEVAAEPARLQSPQADFARILKSFRVTQAGQGADAPGPLAGVQFQRWTDPTENAFSLEAPADWRVSGGIKRINITGRTSEWVMQSPDGQVMIRSGDVNVPTSYIELNQTIANFGYREGQMYSGGMMISRFLPAVEFAANYVQMTAGRNCSNLQWLAQRDRPDFVQQLAQQGLALQENRNTAGEVTFTCQMSGQPYVGYFFAETYATPDMGVATTWNLKTLYGFIAPADRAQQADAVLQRAFSSFELNPQWMAAERGMQQRTAEDNRRYREFASNLQQQTQAERWASWERITEQRGDILRGQTRVVDPESGEAYKVQSGSSYYWVDPTHEVIAGTNTPYKPTWDFREMIETYK